MSEAHVGEAQQAAPRSIQVRMLVGLGEEDSLPLVAGCIDAGMWEVSSPEHTDAQFAAMKRPFEGSGYGYEWREVTVTLSAEKLLKHFSGPVLDGAVSEPDLARPEDASDASKSSSPGGH